MKTVKIVLALFFITLFTNAINAQEVVRKETKQSKKYSSSKQKEGNSLCTFYNTIYNNVYNGFVDLKGTTKRQDVTSSDWETTVVSPNEFIKLYLNTSKQTFTAIIYEDFDKQTAVNKFENIYKSIKDCAKKNGKKIVFIKDDNKLEQTQNRRNVLLTTKTDDILINIKLFNSSYKIDKNGKFKKYFYVAVSFVRLKDKEKAINRFKNM